MQKDADDNNFDYFVSGKEGDFWVFFGDSTKDLNKSELIAIFSSHDLALEYVAFKNDAEVEYDDDWEVGYEYEEEQDEIADLVDEFTKNSWE
jgi:hypothetical protein